MKHIILIGDGMADYPVQELGGRTPLEAANIPNMDLMAQKGRLGLVKTIPEGFSPGSDIANLSILGYDPRKYYTGRAPLEAASMGLKLGTDDVAFRCNLVTLSIKDDEIYMDDFSAGHISTEEAKALISEIDKKLGSTDIRFYPGVSYRHLMVWKKGHERPDTTPPHDISGRAIACHMPKGEGKERIIELMDEAKMLLKDHPINKKRVAHAGKPANAIWLWGQGKAPTMPTLFETYGVSGAVISAVDLIKGIGIYAGLDVVNVPGATGYLDTNYRGKADYALRELEEKDLVYLHVEAPDEAAHSGDLKDKIEAIERFDRDVVGTILDGMDRFGDYGILVLPDHATPLTVMSHTTDPVPFARYSSHDKGTTPSKASGFNEKSAKEARLYVNEGSKLLGQFLEG